MSYAAAGDNRAAAKLFEEALALAPDDPLILANAGHFLLESGGDRRKALTLLDKSVHLDPSNEYAWTYKGMAHCEVTKSKRRMIVTTAPCRSARDSTMRFATRAPCSAIAVSSSGRWRCFFEAESIQEHDQLLHECKGITYERLGRLEEASVSYQRAFDINPRNVKSLVLGANCLIRRKRFADGDELLVRALQIDEGHALAWLIYGSSQYNQQMFERAASCFERCLELDPALAAEHRVEQLLTNCALALFSERMRGKR